MRNKLSVYVLAVGLFASAQLSAASQTPLYRVEKVRAPGAPVPAAVEVGRTDNGIVLEGSVWQSPTAAGRRISGQIKIELLDETGRSLGVRYTDLRAASAAKHTQRAHYTLRLETSEIQGLTTIRISAIPCPTHASPTSLWAEQFARLLPPAGSDAARNATQRYRKTDTRSRSA